MPSNHWVFSIVKEQTSLDLGDGQKILSRGKLLDIPVVTAGLTTKMEFTVTSLLDDVDLIFGDQLAPASQSFHWPEIE